MHRQNNGNSFWGDFGEGGSFWLFFCGANRGEMHGTWEQIVVI
jgi:hypothetical protein